eukprot:TRINITY_DN76421_c0_g1_i1.p2 TRINITY_DN76421_c0_g1~~TRINITY_DN76421_c0_g1_i1.p2  ORF type:complete len:125 (-),score=13.36 TRINITY_DN76421_c0_g1_i1:145-486(-)
MSSSQRRQVRRASRRQPSYREGRSERWSAVLCSCSSSANSSTSSVLSTSNELAMAENTSHRRASSFTSTEKSIPVTGSVTKICIVPCLLQSFLTEDLALGLVFRRYKKLPIAQ